jgi:hypothetical protein
MTVRSIKNDCVYVLIIIISSVMFSACSKYENKQESKQPATEQQKPESLSSAGQKEISSENDLNYGEGRKIFRVDKEDLNKDGNDELMVLSTRSDSPEQGDGPQKFDMLEVFVLDSAKQKYVKTISDTVDFAVDCIYLDMNGTGSKNIFVKTNSGGNSTVASEGMFVYGMSGDRTVKLIKYFDGGAPEITTAGKNKVKLIKVTELFHGVMPMAYAVPYTSSIYEISNNELVLCNLKYPEYYQDRITEATEKYYGLKKKVEMGMQMGDMSYPLYREAAEVIVNFHAKGDYKGLREFWEKEKESLQRNIPQDEFTDLSNFVIKILPADTNA